MLQKPSEDKIYAPEENLLCLSIFVATDYGENFEPGEIPQYYNNLLITRPELVPDEAYKDYSKDEIAWEKQYILIDKIKQCLEELFNEEEPENKPKNAQDICLHYYVSDTEEGEKIQRCWESILWDEKVVFDEAFQLVDKVKRGLDFFKFTYNPANHD